MEFTVGQKVRVYGLMNPRRDYKGVRTIEHIGPMHSGGENMLWFEHGGGAWHPDACEPADEMNLTDGAEIIGRQIWHAVQSGRGGQDVTDILERHLRAYVEFGREDVRDKCRAVVDLGHNDDCIFCGLKDKQIMKIVEQGGTDGRD